MTSNNSFSFFRSEFDKTESLKTREKRQCINRARAKYIFKKEKKIRNDGEESNEGKETSYTSEICTNVHDEKRKIERK